MIERTALPDNVLCAGIMKAGRLVMAVNENLVDADETQEFREWREGNRWTLVYRTYE